MQLSREAGVVAVSILPIYLTWDLLLGFIRNDKARTATAVMLSGATLHIVAEYSGLNAWYLEHSASAFNRRPIVAVGDTTVSYQDGNYNNLTAPLSAAEMDAL